MSDMLVKLYRLPHLDEGLAPVIARGVSIRRALPPEKHVVLAWVEREFSRAWASECDVAFSRQPVSCFVAVRDAEIAGFACYEATCRNFFGPTGVHERGVGIGKALLLACLHAMRAEGYAYAIIGGVGPAEFYSKAVGAIPIEDSAPGVYEGLLV
jgi:hypothetical protein